jgi:hypothetical protein
MIEREQIMPLEYMPNDAPPAKHPVSFKISFIFALLGLATPFLVYLAICLIIPTPRNGEDHTPGDGLGMMVLGIFGIIWWTFVEIVSLFTTLVGFARKETGRIKVFAVAASALSLILIVTVYISMFALVRHVENETKRYESTRNL